MSLTNNLNHINTALRRSGVGRAVTAMAALLLAWSAQADPDRLTLSGFGTLAASWLSNPDADFATNTQPNGPGRSHDVDWGVDSRLGLQVDYGAGSRTTITVQAVAERNPDKTIDPNLTLANLRHQFNNGLTLRGGRLQPTAFLAAEYRLANFANPWVRPPVTVYGLLPLVAQEAFDISYPLATDYGVLTGWLGWNQFDFDASRSNAAGTDPVKGRNGVYMGLKWQKGNWLAKWHWGRFETSYDAPGLRSALAGLSDYDPAAATALTVAEAAIEVLSLGLNYEDNDWLIMAEWGNRESGSAIPPAWGAYLTIGRHIGDLMPYVTAGRRATQKLTVTSRNATAKRIISQLGTSQDYSQWTATLGASYPVCKKALFKLQADWIMPDSNSYGPYTNHDANGYDVQQPATDTLISANLDFVF